MVLSSTIALFSGLGGCSSEQSEPTSASISYHSTRKRIREPSVAGKEWDFQVSRNFEEAYISFFDEEENMIDVTLRADPYGRHSGSRDAITHVLVDIQTSDATHRLQLTDFRLQDDNGIEAIEFESPEVLERCATLKLPDYDDVCASDLVIDANAEFIYYLELGRVKEHLIQFENLRASRNVLPTYTYFDINMGAYNDDALSPEEMYAMSQRTTVVGNPGFDYSPQVYVGVPNDARFMQLSSEYALQLSKSSLEGYTCDENDSNTICLMKDPVLENCRVTGVKGELICTTDVIVHPKKVESKKPTHNSVIVGDYCALYEITLEPGVRGHYVNIPNECMPQ